MSPAYDILLNISTAHTLEGYPVDVCLVPLRGTAASTWALSDKPALRVYGRYYFLARLDASMLCRSIIFHRRIYSLGADGDFLHHGLCMGGLDSRCVLVSHSTIAGITRIPTFTSKIYI